MWEFIKHKLVKLGCFVLIALVMIAATAFTKLVLGWFQHDDASKNAIANQVGESVGKGLLGFVVFAGFIVMGRQLVASLRGENGSPPTRPSAPPPLSQEPLERGGEPPSSHESRKHEQST